MRLGMPSGEHERGRPHSRLDAQIELLLHGVPGVEGGVEGAAAWPPDWRGRGEVDYLYREGNVLVRDVDVDRVLGGDDPILRGSPVEHENNLRGVTRIQLA